MNFGKNYASVNDRNLYRRNVNPNLVGMNTQFKKNIITGNDILRNNNQYENAMLHNNVIPKSPLESEYINKPNKVILYKSFTVIDPNTNVPNTHTFILNETLKDVVSVKLVRAIVIGNKSLYSAGVDFFVLHIDELKKNYGEKNATDKISNSFAILDYDKVSDNGTEKLYFENSYACNRDIKYFDPPLNALSKLTCNLYKENTGTVNAVPIQLKLELLIETKEKLRVY